MIDEAVAEIHRLGDHPQMVGVLFASNPLRRPLGDPIYHPIYAAAAEYGLAITSHIGIEHARQYCGYMAMSSASRTTTLFPGRAERSTAGGACCSWAVG